MMGGGWDLFQIAYRNSISRSLPLQDFFRVQVPCSIFFGGGGGGEFYCCNLNHDTCHNLITWNRLQTNICFFCFSQSFCFTQCQNYIIQGKDNEASDTFLEVLFPNWSMGQHCIFCLMSLDHKRLSPGIGLRASSLECFPKRSTPLP